jgi:two-component system, OmpR family, response regulator VicR
MIKILYVEDEPFLGKIVKESLESRQFEVKMVADGALVMAEYEAFQPDICVLDVMLPNVDGFTLGQELRKKAPHLPILFLTAKTQTGDVLKGFESGGNDYIRKPFSMEELIVRVQNLVQLSTGTPKTGPFPNASGFRSSTVFDSKMIGKYEFIPQKYELRFGENARKLSHRESELLKILDENRHFVINRKDILMKIWGDDSFFNSRNLDVYITKMRDYLKEDTGIQIMTIKGVGYNFIVE